jgi:hypothetical protein
MKTKEGFEILQEGHKYEMWETCIAVPLIDLAEGRVTIRKNLLNLSGLRKMIKRLRK